MTLQEFKNTADSYGKSNTPFVFLIDFEMQKPLLYKLDEVAKAGLFFAIDGFSNFDRGEAVNKKTTFDIQSISKELYSKAFKAVQAEIKKGNTYLLNLTFPTQLQIQHLDLETVFACAQAPYKLLKSNDFVLYSPECFVKIADDIIRSFPMKGTIDASLENAEKQLLSSPKETYEHNTIVDLIRNDLAMVARNIKVERFRYIDRVQRPQGELLQVCSEISGTMPHDWKNHIGNILLTLLPAGSISGAPKQKTMEIIRDAEKQARGYYTGIFGIFDGNKLDSAVNIRYIEKTEQGYFYRSGGGITALSQCEEEYNELLEKIYVPTI